MTFYEGDFCKCGGTLEYVEIKGIVYLECSDCCEVYS
jgi:hypothetical protein